MKRLITLLIWITATVAAIAQQNASQLLKQGDDFYAAKQYKQAVENYQKAAQLGNAEAQFNYAYALYNGEGIDRDYASAAMWFKRAARQNFAKAQYNLAYCYMYGRGVPADYDKALRYLTDAANNNNQNAQLTLAECYEKGVLVGQDKEMSQRWKDKAAGKIKENIKTPEVEEAPQPVVEIAQQPTNPKPTTPAEPAKPVEPVQPQPTQPAPTVIAAAPTPPEVRILFPEDKSYFHTESIKLRYQLLAQGLEKETKVTVLVDGQKQPADRAVRAANTIDVDLPNRDCSITIYAQNKNGNSEPVSIRLIKESMPEELPRLFAVTVGVGDYNDEQLPKLKYTTKDAQDFAANLLGSNIVLIDGNQLTKLMITGHGFRDEKDRFYFMPYGGTTNKLYNCFSSNDFRVATEDINSKLIVFVDACYSGALMGGNRSAAGSHFMEQLRRTKNGMVMYASSASDTKSKENEDWKNGAFTKSLVEAFNGAARNPEDEGLSTQQLDQYLYKQVRKLTDYKQTPIFMNPNGMEPFNIFTYGQ